METENKNVKEISLVVSIEEVNLLLAGLGELPAKLSLNLIEKIKGQAIKQLDEQQ